MRSFVLSLVLFVAALLPNVGAAQAHPLRTAPPEVTAAAAEWQVNSEPILANSSVYRPTRAFRTFDRQVMTQVGVYQGVPLYADVTLEPDSLIYVPVGRDRLRVYERRRDNELAGMTGSGAPSIAVERPSARSDEKRMVGTAGSVVPPAAGSTVVTPRPRRTTIETIPRPRTGNRGVWLDFVGQRWYSAGTSSSYSPDRFTKVGEYRGFPVYVEKSGKMDTIWVQVVNGGPLAPYAKR